ncbi:MAG TPA: winged helix-turn-helix transcriptional regulator [Pseudonocardiaceae bacterium]|jgi:DNA-binding Lrp family transcriptional regulator|nr:winged helix-turn-helix transcriptional regulator [Pseudonocardiaceae bacterium]
MTNSRQLAESRHEPDELDALGMAPADARTYLALIAHPRATAAELAEQCGLSPQRVGRALARLTADGVAGRVPGRPPRYLATSPDVALGALLARKENELRGARARMHELMDVFRETSRFTHPAELVEVLTGQDNINNRVVHLHNVARQQIRGFDRPPYLSRPGSNIGRETTRLAEGIVYRVIYDREAIALPGRLQQDILASGEQGERARVRPELPMKLLLADERLAIIPISPSRHVVDAAYVLHPSALLDALVTLFELEWDRAVPLAKAIGGAVDEPAAEPDEERATLLTLLAAGQTDAGIGRALGWSPRTTQRRVRDLMAELNATTRFQAGLAAKDRGWL